MTSLIPNRDRLRSSLSQALPVHRQYAQPVRSLEFPSQHNSDQVFVKNIGKSRLFVAFPFLPKHNISRVELLIVLNKSESRTRVYISAIEHPRPCPRFITP
jgi:hypothetical protein